jgi:hypothetical protein
MSVLFNGAIFALVMFIGDRVRHIIGPWYVYVGEGVFFGVVMTVFSYFKEKKKRRNR